ncbi:hypothetical protein KY285_001098 [Solanum tuberosum]|nr:hypothetical protein KY285_001098 [Solanum tuberosum]
MSKDILSAVDKRKNEALEKKWEKPKSRKSSEKGVTISKKGEEKEPVKKIVKKTSKRRREVSPDTEKPIKNPKSKF